MQLALTAPCVSYLMKTGETKQDSLSKTHTLGLCPMQLALTDPWVSYLMKTGETIRTVWQKLIPSAYVHAACTHRSLCKLPHENRWS